METVIGVRFKEGGKTYYFSPGEFEIKEGDGVIVETSRGTEFGDVVLAPRELDEAQIVTPLKAVIRVATDHDREQNEKNRAKEKDAFDICLQKIEAHKLDMKLVDVEYSFNGSKIVFYFTADGRVDFRELVKDLASVFKTRIELRQIGVRDEAKMLGGLGPCGRPICCAQFLAEFTPVSIKMAKEQNLSLSPTKISGVCGRLMCCLKYEEDCYEAMRRKMPRVGKEIMTPDGLGTVIENNVITERTRVTITLPDGTLDMREYPYTDLYPKDGPKPVRQPEPADEDERNGAFVPQCDRCAECPARGAGEAGGETADAAADGDHASVAGSASASDETVAATDAGTGTATGAEAEATASGEADEAGVQGAGEHDADEPAEDAADGSDADEDADYEFVPASADSSDADEDAGDEFAPASADDSDADEDADDEFVPASADDSGADEDAGDEFVPASADDSGADGDADEARRPGAVEDQDGPNGGSGPDERD